MQLEHKIYRRWMIMSIYHLPYDKRDITIGYTLCVLTSYKKILTFSYIIMLLQEDRTNLSQNFRIQWYMVFDITTVYIPNCLVMYGDALIWSTSSSISFDYLANALVGISEYINVYYSLGVLVTTRTCSRSQASSG